jgi:hypothetical protein
MSRSPLRNSWIARPAPSISLAQLDRASLAAHSYDRASAHADALVSLLRLLPSLGFAEVYETAAYCLARDTVRWLRCAHASAHCSTGPSKGVSA